MKIKIVFLFMLLFTVSTGMQAQSLGEAILSALLGEDDKPKKEGKDPTHKYIDAGGMVGLVLPRNIASLDLVSVYWNPVDSRYIRVKESSKTSATIQGLRSTSSTVINAKYTYKTWVDGKEKNVTENFPFTITIRRVEPESISLPQITTVGWGLSRALPIRLTPEFAECDFMYDSDDTNVAMVNGDGYLYGVNIGETDVVVETSNGLRCETHVRCVIPDVSEVKITGYDKKEKHEIGDEFDLSYHYAPEHAIPDVRWSSSDREVATVDEHGHVTIVGAGTVHIILMDKTGKKNDIKIKIKKKKK